MKNKYDKLHSEESLKVLENNFCDMCIKHEGNCQRDFERCWTANKVFFLKIKKIFDKYDK